MSFDRVNIQSTQGQLLYAEIPYTNATGSQPVQASFASNDDLDHLDELNASENNLNFFVRQTGPSNGVIVVTSNRPINSKQISLAVKVQDGDGTYIKQIKDSLSNSTSTPNLATNSAEKALLPQVVTEKDIQLNLPTSTAYTSATPSNQTALLPATNNTAAQQTVKATEPPSAPASKNQPQTTTLSKPNSTAAKSSPRATPSAVKPKPQKQAAKKNSAPVPNKNTVRHYTVKSQDTLWNIAAQIAANTHQPIHMVLKQLKAQNEQAFVRGNINRLKQGATLNLNMSSAVRSAKSAPRQNLAATRYRLDNDQMSIITDNQDNVTNHANPKNGQNLKNNTNKEQLMLVRQNTLAIQKQVTQLDFALQQKNHKLDLLNARLAQLQQQLKQRQAANKQQHH
ncbi:hypothetical protein [Acinetobacter sp. MD2(2019)]|uniref:type IV pilus assembly protein FimV n=1 Tax=Acinetobacter sp. MD2(2019) TaxID=2605273 RepID=UPI002D1ECD13|nr:hypothetical protein [Acinetobacter sp. MD2(2019)]MEB3753065.1 hypothetical protein [Acinetobacter sp. MD2(2019)]